jgi:hypothetical protein
VGAQKPLTPDHSYRHHRPPPRGSGYPATPGCHHLAHVGVRHHGHPLGIVGHRRLELPQSWPRPVLADCEAHLTAGAIAEAYKLFTRPGAGDVELENHRGIGFSFITKILYFLARNSPDGVPTEYPLILDTEVSKALAQLTGYRLLVRPADYRPRPDSAAYAQYVKTTHAWAYQLKVLPEVIEYYLWNEASRRGSPLWSACQRQHASNFLLCTAPGVCPDPQHTLVPLEGASARPRPCKNAAPITTDGVSIQSS